MITCSRQVLVFFCFLLAFTLAVFLQDPILESYGAEVFGLPIAATASLSAVWGVGTLLGLLVAGLWLVPKLGKFTAARLGCQLILLSLLLLAAVGSWPIPMHCGSCCFCLDWRQGSEPMPPWF